MSDAAGTVSAAELNGKNRVADKLATTDDHTAKRLQLALRTESKGRRPVTTCFEFMAEDTVSRSIVDFSAWVAIVGDRHLVGQKKISLRVQALLQSDVAHLPPIAHAHLR